jgi:hypothetical protein
MLLCACAPEVPDHSLRIQVLAVEPVAGARVRMWWLDRDGHPLRRDGQPTKDTGLTAGSALAEGQTDAQGVVELRTGPAYGLVALMATGGTTRDPWVSPAGGGSAPDAGLGAADGEVTNDVELRSVLVDFVPGPASRDVVITPLTTLAVALGERRLGHPFKEDTYAAAVARAFEILGKHFWRLDLTRPPGESPIGFDGAVEYTLALQGLAALAHRIAEASGMSGRSFHTLTLLQSLLRDASDDRALMDGIAPEGRIVLGDCPSTPPGSGLAGCASADPLDDPACRSICALDGNTLRAHLASALAFDFLPSANNQTGLSIDDVRALVLYLQANVERELFGDAGAIELDGPLPVMELGASPVYDEQQDTITFGEHAVPIHQPGPDSLVDLAQPGACPTVGKHIHRLSNPNDNALRWNVVVRDRTGWSNSSDATAPLQYRIQLRDPLATSDACSTDGNQAWITDWISVDGMASTDDGISYEVVLLREDVPELAELGEGEFEIVFRGQDALGQEAVACRCWNHVLLPAPLEVGDITVATGVGSLDAHSLHPGNNLAPLLGQHVPPEEAVVLASFEIRNGTDVPGYVRMSTVQPLVRFTKCWQRGNTELSFTSVPDFTCIPQQTCLSMFPPDRQTAVVVDTGIVNDFVTELRVQETTAPPAIGACVPGDDDTRCIGPRISPTAARVHRVDLMIGNLSALAPRTSSEDPGIYFESTLAPPDATPITGVISEGIFHICARVEFGTCSTSGMYQYYRALSAAELVMEDTLSVRVTMIPAPHLRLSPITDAITKLESFAWRTHEQSLPPLFPVLPLSEAPPPCPIP